MENSRPVLADEDRVLLLVARTRDAEIAVSLLGEVGMAATVCESPAKLVHEIGRGAGLAVIAEETLVTADLHPLAAWIESQPPWSDFPFVLLTGRSMGLQRNPLAGRLMEILGNVSFIERPFHPTTLISAVRGALRARRRQY